MKEDEMNSDAAATEFAEIQIPESPSSEPFFEHAAEQLVWGVIESIIARGDAPA